MMGLSANVAGRELHAPSEPQSVQVAGEVEESHEYQEDPLRSARGVQPPDRSLWCLGLDPAEPERRQSNTVMTPTLKAEMGCFIDGKMTNIYLNLTYRSV